MHCLSDVRFEFPGDIQVFYVAPPALNELKRWLNDQSQVAQRAAAAAQQAAQTSQEEPAEQTESSESSGDIEGTEPTERGETQ